MFSFFRFLCHLWTVNLHQNASLSSTHDLGFMIHPWARLAWELEHDVRAYNTIIRAARTLAARFSPAIGAIRSWDTCITKRYSFQDPSEDFLVIIVGWTPLGEIAPCFYWYKKRHSFT